jgi:carbon-monoxide dehydrogenase large subunit
MSTSGGCTWADEVFPSPRSALLYPQAMGARYFGASVQRVEDPRLLTGDGRYVDDVQLPGLLHAGFVRSPHGHARVGAINAEAARQLPGVTGVFTYETLEHWMRPLPPFGAVPPLLGKAIDFKIKPTSQPPMARDAVRYVGEIVAMVVAESRHVAENGAELIEVEYEPLPPVVDMVGACEADAPLIYPEWGDNVALAFSNSIGDPDGAFSRADVTLSERFNVQRYVGMPLEARGVVASYDRRNGSLTTWNSTQTPHFVQQNLANVLDLPVHKVRVLAPDVGGGFGTKANGYPEDVLIPLAARSLGQPVKWSEDRREHFMAAAGARHQVHMIEVAARSDGTIVGFRDRVFVDLGAYNAWGVVLPYNTVAHLIGLYRVKNLFVDVKAVVTNKMPNAPYRGAGRPEVVFAVERAVDCVARELGMDPAEVRRKNYIRPEEMPYQLDMPYRDGNPLVYDSGDFPATLEQALAAAGYADFRAGQERLREQGIYRGIGMAGYIEGTGIGPYESASVKVDLSGRVVVATGACSQGQGHETTWAQVAADRLGVPIGWVTVVEGDTDAVSLGLGTYASRGAVTAGSSIVVAAAEVREKLVNAAAQLMEASPEDIVIEDGQVSIQGVADSAMPLGRLVQACLPTFAQPGPAEPKFEASAYHHVPTVTYSNAVHVAMVEVDPETGVVEILKYVVAHDCGPVINPRIVDGQIHGGVAQGIGGALFEELVYDENAQLLTGSFLDYLVPTAMEVPSIDNVHLHTASPRNPLGVKGVGEGGAISPPAAVSNAVEDALAPFGVRITETPLSPARLVKLLREARRQQPAEDTVC